MLLFPAKVRNSPIAGKGLFSTAQIPKGALVIVWGLKCHAIPEETYRSINHDPIVHATGIRWVDNVFFYDTQVRADDYINHSFQPNLLYHCGSLFALRPIPPGVELTANYEHFLSEGEKSDFIDTTSGLPVVGLSGKEALRRSACELIALVTDSVEKDGVENYSTMRDAA